MQNSVRMGVRVKIELPQVGESVTEGVIGKWLKRVGDSVEKYDPLVEVVTDKVNMEMPSPVSGVLTHILAQEGETVPMGAPIAEIEVEGEVPDQPDPSAPTAAGTRARIGHPRGHHRRAAQGRRPRRPHRLRRRAKRARVPAAPVSPAACCRRHRAAPHQSAPTQAILARGHAPGRRAQPRPLAAGGHRHRGPRHQEGRAPPPRVRARRRYRARCARAGGLTAEPAPQEDETRLPLTPTRRLIAANMTRSATEIPQAWSITELDVSGLVARREALKDGFREREGVNLTYLPFVLKAVAEALKENPLVNSSWDADAVILKRRINIGIAVAAPAGLIVPVLHDADALSVSGLARRLDDLTRRARAGELTLDGVQGGTFTLNNTGALGSVASQPIINHGQAAILTTEAIVKRPVVVGDGIAIRSMMNICFTFDHRIMDGAEASAFTNSVKHRLEAIGPQTGVY